MIDLWTSTDDICLKFFHSAFIIYILKLLVLQRKRLVDFTDVLEQLECSNSECDEISSGEDIVDVDIEENTSDVAEDSDSSDDNVPLADLPCSKEAAGKYKFEKRRTFVPPTLPPFIPEERIPIEYICMFFTDDMLEHLAFESNKYGTEKNSNSPNITKEELETFIGIYFLVGIIKMRNIEDYWNSSLHIHAHC